jgi:CysZ protein
MTSPQPLATPAAGIPVTALDSLRRGARLAFSPALRHWALLPLAANALVFLAAGALLWSLVTGWLETLAVLAGSEGWLAGVAGALVGILKVVLVGVLLVGSAWLFSALLHVVAGPFLGLLAAAADRVAHGHAPPAEPFARLATRTLRRSLRMLGYWALRALGLALLTLPMSFIPGVNLLVAPLWFAFGGWMMAVACFDYPSDNRGADFDTMLAVLARQRLLVLGWGCAVLALAMVPLVNLVILPVAVCAATLLWAERLQPAAEA